MSKPDPRIPGPTRRTSDFDDEVPLDREEEIGRSVGAAEEAAATAPPDAAVDLLFKTRLRELGPRPPVAVSPDTSVAEACQKMKGSKVGCVLVMDGAKIVGIFTERDALYRVACSDRRPSEVRIAEVMTPDPTTLRPGHRLAHALNKMSLDGCRHVPIVDESGRPLGVVSVRRIVDFLVEQFPAKLLNLPPDPDQTHDRQEGG